MAHKHHPKEARIRAVQQQDGCRPASEICKDMNITPGTLKRWRDQWDGPSYLVQPTLIFGGDLAPWRSHG